MTQNLTNITLSPGQDNALADFVQFLCDPNETVWVLEGYSGTGKTTLVSTLLDRLKSYISAARLIWLAYPDYVIQLTATTNKAADMFSQLTGEDVRTIHSFLELRLWSDPKTGKKQLVPKIADNYKYNFLLFVDEASYINSPLLRLIFSQTKNCKIVFIGDPAQLLSPGDVKAPVFMAGFRTAKLTETMRQLVNGVPQANPITDLATMFRERVNDGPWPKFTPDGKYVKYMDRQDFDAEIIKEFTRPDWHYHDSKVLAYTNDCVIAYNNAIRNHVSGDPDIQVGDYVENNSFISNGKSSVKTDQLVLVTDIEADSHHHGVFGNWVTLDHSLRFFFPKSRKDKHKFIAAARANSEWNLVREGEGWIDLRAVFAQTINKAQGSTYKKVFIDLSNIKTCTSGDQIARMMYVGVSRATTEVILTGDLV
jgi:hypothetical protein